MRVLVCDQESEMLETVARWFEVDTATSKVTCVDLMRANPFDVVIASERLSDGSGLELLSHIATRWPDTLRVLAMEQDRMRLLRGKLGPFKLHATLRYPIEEDEFEKVLNRMYDILVREAEAPAPKPLEVPAADTSKIQKVTLPQQGAKGSSPITKGENEAPHGGGAWRSAPAAPPTSPRMSARAAKDAPPLGAPRPPTPEPVRRKLGNYTPLGSPDDEHLRIVGREFDHTAAPLAARAIRAREAATRVRTPKEKLGMLRTHLRDTLKKLLKR